MVIDIPLWDYEKQDEFIKKRVGLHSEAYFEMDTDGNLPDCTPEEMWEKTTTYAVKKDGGVRAKSVHQTMADAEVALPAKGYFIEVREGERTRCANYCQVSQFCNQYQTYLKEKP